MIHTSTGTRDMAASVSTLCLLCFLYIFFSQKAQATPKNSNTAPIKESFWPSRNPQYTAIVRPLNTRMAEVIKNEKKWFVMQRPHGAAADDEDVVHGPFQSQEEALKYCKEVAPPGRKEIYSEVSK